jgi:hypothetical protein
MAACPNRVQPAAESAANRTWFARWPPIGGVVSRSQLLAGGVSGWAIDRAVGSGALHRLYAGVYAVVAPELLTEDGSWSRATTCAWVDRPSAAASANAASRSAMTACGSPSICFCVAARDVAVGAQPEVAVVVTVGLVRALVLAAFELDDDAAVGP